MAHAKNWPHSSTDSLRVGFVLAPKFSQLPFSYIIESLRHAADEVDLSRQIYCSWDILAVDDKLIFSSCGFGVTPTAKLTDPNEYDYVIVVGGLLPYCLQMSQEYWDFLRAAVNAKVRMVGVCVGSFILAELGILDGKQCAVHFYHIQDFQQRYPKAYPVSDLPVVEHDNILTSPGGSAGLNLATLLIGRHCGKARAIKVMRSMYVNKDMVYSTTPSHKFIHLSTCGDHRVENAIDLMERNINSNVAISEIAQRLMISPIVLNRLFQKHAGSSPSAVFRDIRMSYAVWLLLNTTRTITQIAFDSGFSDASHFLRWFKREFFESPGSFRRSRRKTKL